MINKDVEKMLLVTNHQAIANQNHNAMSSHTCQNGYYKNKIKQKAASFGEDVEFSSTRMSNSFSLGATSASQLPSKGQM